MCYIYSSLLDCAAESGLDLSIIRPGQMQHHYNERKIQMNENDIQKLIDNKREAFRKFDARPAEERRQLDEQGLNPHDKPEVRKRKAAAYLERCKREFDELPKEQRDIMEKFGCSPYQRGLVVCRSPEYFEKYGTYVIDIENRAE